MAVGWKTKSMFVVIFVPSYKSASLILHEHTVPFTVIKDEWEDGFFDRDSFTEIMQAWAQSVICGRARLGGIPVGVIAVETRSVELDIPADPANLDSEAKVSIV